MSTSVISSDDNNYPIPLLKLIIIISSASGSLITILSVCGIVVCVKYRRSKRIKRTISHKRVEKQSPDHDYDDINDKRRVSSHKRVERQSSYHEYDDINDKRRVSSHKRIERRSSYHEYDDINDINVRAVFKKQASKLRNVCKESEKQEQNTKDIKKKKIGSEYTGPVSSNLKRINQSTNRDSNQSLSVSSGHTYLELDAKQKPPCQNLEMQRSNYESLSRSQVDELESSYQQLKKAVNTIDIEMVPKSYLYKYN